MQDNAQNNWKLRLENANDLPAEVLKDKNEAWEKLHTRLHNQPARKFRTWYWAAACLLAISITTIVFFNSEKQQPSVTVSSPTIENPSIKKQQLHTKQKENGSYLISSSPKRKNLVITQKNSAAKKNEPASNHNFLIDSAKGQTISATVIEPALHFDSSVKEKITAAPVKKKLRVIHINDLGQPAIESTADNKPSGKHVFQLRILDNEYYHSSSPDSRNNGLILFKSQNISN